MATEPSTAARTAEIINRLMTAEHPKRVIYSLEAPQTVIYSIFTVFNVICSTIELRVLL